MLEEDKLLFQRALRQYGLGLCLLCLLISCKHGGVKDRVLSGLPVVRS